MPCSLLGDPGLLQVDRGTGSEQGLGIVEDCKKEKKEGKVSILWTRPSVGLDAPVQSSGSSMELFVHLFTHSFIRLSTQCLFTECKAL